MVKTKFKKKNVNFLKYIVLQWNPGYIIWYFNVNRISTVQNSNNRLYHAHATLRILIYF